MRHNIRKTPLGRMAGWAVLLGVLLSVMVSVLTMTGCTTKTITVYRTGDYTTAVDAHYVIMRETKQLGSSSNTKKVWLYDCLSFPDGERWDPTCQRVDLTKNASGKGARRDAKRGD